MFIAYLTLLSALSISGVAIFYSVIGLATIFPGAFWPVVIMGSVLEVGKLVTASWLYRHWKQTRFLLKSYLTIAVIVLSLITSMGIFGFLSKAHLEQNLAENTVMQRIEIINNKIISEETYIKRQTLIIERAEKSLQVTVNTNDDAINIEKENLKSVEDKFKTLLAVETNTINNLNDRIKSLDADVTAILTQKNKAFFNEEKAAAELKASQKEERESINKGIDKAQDRITRLKEDYAMDTAVIQKRIEKLRDSDVDDKSDVYAQIEIAEANILKAQNNIDDLVIDREPLEAKMIKLEAEIGPVKYIAALAIDWGVTKDVDTEEAVRWVILVIICVFDPLAVLLLVAANQSLLRRFPVKPLPPEEVLDLEKPDDEDITLKWNEAMAEKQKHTMEQATTQLKEWKDKLEAFNKKVPKPEEKPVKIVQKKTEQEEIDAYKDKKAKEEEYERKIQEQAEKEKQLERFKQREKEEQEALEEVARKAKEEEYNFEDEVEGFEDFNKKPEPAPVPEEPKSTTVEEALKMPTSESVQTPIEDSDRTKPDFTQVFVPETTFEKPTERKGMLGTVVVKDKKVVKPNNMEEIIKEQQYVQNEEQTKDTIWQSISKDKLTKYKNRLTTDQNYHTLVEQRIDKLITQLEAGEIKLKDLTKEDQKVIIDTLNQNN